MSVKNFRASALRMGRSSTEGEVSSGITCMRSPCLSDLQKDSSHRRQKLVTVIILLFILTLHCELQCIISHMHHAAQLGRK